MNIHIHIYEHIYALNNNAMNFKKSSEGYMRVW